MTVYLDNLVILDQAANRHTVLGGILAEHRKPSQFTNLYHRAPTASTQTVADRCKALRKQLLDVSVPVVGVALAQSQDVSKKLEPILQPDKEAKITYPARISSSLAFFGRQSQAHDVSPRTASHQELENYAKTFSDWARTLYPTKNIDNNTSPLKRLDAWKQVLTHDEKESVKQKVRLHYTRQALQTPEELETLLNSLQVPEESARESGTRAAMAA